MIIKKVEIAMFYLIKRELEAMGMTPAAPAVT